MRASRKNPVPARKVSRSIARMGVFFKQPILTVPFLLVLCLVVLMWGFSLMSDLDSCKSDIRIASSQMPVVGVPGSEVGVYEPRRSPESDILLKSFAADIVYAINHYTTSNLDDQYLGVRRYFFRDIRELTNGIVKKRLGDRSQSAEIFVDWDSYKVERVQKLPSFAKVNLKGPFYKVSFDMTKNIIMGGTRTWSKNIRVDLYCKYIKDMHLKENQWNPFGYMLAYYAESFIDVQPDVLAE